MSELNEKMELENGTAETKKKSLLARTGEGVQKVRIKLRSTRSGRALITITKGAAIGLGLYGSYRLGQKSVKPTTVYIESGVTEDTQEEAPEEENEVNEEHD